jgi:hypothetical protein
VNDDTPLMQPIDRALHARTHRPIHVVLEEYRQGALTCPTIAGEPCPCADGTATCKYRRIDGGVLWSCPACSREWIVANSAAPEDDDTAFWGTAVLVLGVVSISVLLGVGFAAGYVLRGWLP